MTITPEKLDELEQLAELATPGPYTAHDGNGCGCGQVFSTTADTIIAAAIGARHESYTCGDGVPDEQVATNAGYFAALDPATVRELVRAAKERQWIPVSERLPEPYTKVALVNSGQFENAPFDTPVHGVGYWVPEFFGYWNIRGERPLTRDSFTHWMPLPEVPHD